MSSNMAKSMRMEPLPHENKIMARQPTDKLVLICKSFMSKNSSYNSLKKQVICKEANHISDPVMRGTMMAEAKSKKSLIIISKNRKAHPASARFLGLLGPFFDCVAIQGLNFSGFVVVIVVVVVAAIFLRLVENLKLWKWLMHQFKAKKCVKHKPRDEKRSTALGRKWAWIEDLVPSLDVSGIDDLFISICILMGLGLVCGFLVLFRRIYSKNVRK